MKRSFVKLPDGLTTTSMICSMICKNAEFSYEDLDRQFKAYEDRIKSELGGD